METAVHGEAQYTEKQSIKGFSSMQGNSSIWKNTSIYWEIAAYTANISLRGNGSKYIRLCVYMGQKYACIGPEKSSDNGKVISSFLEFS